MQDNLVQNNKEQYVCDKSSVNKAKIQIFVCFSEHMLLKVAQKMFFFFICRYLSCMSKVLILCELMADIVYNSTCEVVFPSTPLMLHVKSCSFLYHSRKIISFSRIVKLQVICCCAAARWLLRNSNLAVEQR